MLRKKASGFTLIELMVVIVIIGVLASLAIPRFTEASAKAKAVEAPRVIASYESAFLAGVAEAANPLTIQIEDLIYTNPTESKWWAYDFSATPATTDNPTKKTTGTAEVYAAAARGKMAGIDAADVLATAYTTAGDGCFDRKTNTKIAKSQTATLKKMVPNYAAGCAPATGAVQAW